MVDTKENMIASWKHNDEEEDESYISSLRRINRMVIKLKEEDLRT